VTWPPLPDQSMPPLVLSPELQASVDRIVSSCTIVDRASLPTVIGLPTAPRRLG
jgi:hypothetical protein